ncbi:MAG: diacylglycerol kinase family protein [Oscillospiraceae bacterium]|nr:diacylglycerol kinase family protein [Oscillospiraceae bacterium]
MSTYHILYNRLSRSNTGELEAHMLDEIMSGENLKYWNVADIEDYHKFFADITFSDKIILACGDGTMNRFINDTDYCHVPQEVYFFPAGSGNDFARDIGKSKHCEPFEIRKFISNLPAIVTGGKEQRFFNSASIGVDAQVCLEADRLKSLGRKSVNYSVLAVKCILTKYKFCDAVVTDEKGKEHHFKDVLLAITTKGRYFGGGVKISPTQDRNDPDETLTFIIAHSLPAWKALIVFASIPMGKHFNFKKHVTVMKGKEFRVKFTAPTPIQIDGETVEGQSEYHAFAKHTVEI